MQSDLLLLLLPSSVKDREYYWQMPCRAGGYVTLLLESGPAPCLQLSHEEGGETDIQLPSRAS